MHPLEWSPTQSPGKVGRRGEPNSWVTFYAYLARKHGERLGFFLVLFVPNTILNIRGHSGEGSAPS